MSLRVWLPLNGNLNNQGLSDITVTNNGATVDNNGKIGKCYAFSGSNYISETAYTNFGENYSISLWFYCTSSSATQTFLCTRNAVGAGFSLFIIGGKLRIDSSIANSSSLQWTTNLTIPINTWHHLVVIRNSGTVSYYMDGEFKESKAVAYTGNCGNILTIGASQANGSTFSNYYQGKLNDICIYDHVLSADDINQIYQEYKEV